jgi:hypothetical protein
MCRIDANGKTDLSSFPQGVSAREQIKLFLNTREAGSTSPRSPKYQPRPNHAHVFLARRKSCKKPSVIQLAILFILQSSCRLFPGRRNQMFLRQGGT